MNPMVVSYAALAGAIVLEVTGTTFLQRSEQFTRLGPTAVMVLAYTSSFYLLSQALRHVPLGIAYGTWGGLGIVLTAAVSVLVFKQRLDVPALVGLAFIITGVVLVNGFSKSMSH